MIAERKVQGISIFRLPVLRYVSTCQQIRRIAGWDVYLSAINGGRILPGTLAAFMMISM